MTKISDVDARGGPGGARGEAQVGHGKAQVGHGGRPKWDTGGGHVGIEEAGWMNRRSVTHAGEV